MREQRNLGLTGGMLRQADWRAAAQLGLPVPNGPAGAARGQRPKSQPPHVKKAEVGSARRRWWPRCPQ